MVVIPVRDAGLRPRPRCAPSASPRERGPKTVGMVLLNHGIFSFGDTRARVLRAHDRPRDARRGLPRKHDGLERSVRRRRTRRRRCRCAATLAALRRDDLEAAGFPMMLAAHADSRSLAFARRDDVAPSSPAGPGDARPRDPHQARAAARARRRRLRRRLPALLRRARAARRESRRPCSTRRRAWCSTRELGVCTVGPDRAGRGDRRTTSTAHTMDIISAPRRLGG
ncbi:MAG: hypothetical protein MZV65_37845 [Chromatiales bacterium]|nr:hypothetical protein [Chromatiales bacterium]